MTRTRWITALAATGALALALAGCGQSGTPGGEGSGEGGAAGGDTPEYTVADDFSLEESETWKVASERGTIRIGVKYDQPGLANVEVGSELPEGFDVEIAKLVAAGIGFAPEDIEFIETVTPNREPFLQQRTVDLVVASYTINDERKQVIDFAGPYYMAGQDLLVLADSEINGPDDLAGTTVCSADASTTAMRIETDYPEADLVTYDAYPKCINDLQAGNVDAVTTDDSILRGYAAQYGDEMRVVGEPFSEEPYGIGMPKDEQELRTAINEILEQAREDGTWVEAFESTLGDSSGVEQPATEDY